MCFTQSGIGEALLRTQYDYYAYLDEAGTTSPPGESPRIKIIPPSLNPRISITSANSQQFIIDCLPKAHHVYYCLLLFDQ